jgi:Uma2 family endonuclease
VRSRADSATTRPRRGQPTRRWYDAAMSDSVPLDAEGVRPLKRTEYDQLVELGFFEDERLELLRGLLVTMSPQKPRHANVPAVLGALLVRALGSRAQVRQHSPLALGEYSEPEPDIAVVPPGDYSRAHPATALLIVEAADSSLRQDRRFKAALYAEHGIPEYWIVNLVESVVEVHTLPAAGRYTRVETCGMEQSVCLLAFPDVRVHLGALFS